MTTVQGVSKTITNHVLRTLNGKICSEMYKVFEAKGDVLNSSILKPIFGEDYEAEIYDIYLDEIQKIFDPELHKLRIYEGIIQAMNINNIDTTRIQKKYNELKQKNKKNGILHNITQKIQSVKTNLTQLVKPKNITAKKR
jgi:hypothetical protein